MIIITFDLFTIIIEFNNNILTYIKILLSIIAILLCYLIMKGDKEK